MGGRGSSSSKANGRSTRTNQRSGPAALKGTDRQIEYATSIRNDVNQIFEDAKNMANANRSRVSAAQYENAINTIRERQDALNKAESSSAIINLFQNVRRTGNINKDLPNLYAVYNTSYPTSNAEADILLKKRRKP